MQFALFSVQQKRAPVVNYWTSLLICTLCFGHRRSQGCTGCTCTPQGREKNWPNLQRKVV